MREGEGRREGGREKKGEVQYGSVKEMGRIEAHDNEKEGVLYDVREENAYLLSKHI